MSTLGVCILAQPPFLIGLFSGHEAWTRRQLLGVLLGVGGEPMLHASE